MELLLWFAVAMINKHYFTFLGEVFGFSCAFPCLLANKE